MKPWVNWSRLIGATPCGATIPAKDLDVLKKDLTDLKAKVAAHAAQKSADDKAAVEVKEYRSFLESMTDRALKTFGIVIAITAAALTVIGIKLF